MIKFGFKIKTRGGMAVDNLIVVARDRAEAERKVAQIYPHCKVIICRELQRMVVVKDGFSLEDAITLIGKESNPETPAKKD